MGWIELHDRARLQGGVLHVGQAPDLGVPRSTIDGRAGREGWRRLQPGVLAMPGADLNFIANCWAAALAAGPRAMIGGRAALHLAGLPDQPREIDVVVPYDRNVRLRSPVRVRRSRTLFDLDIASGRGPRRAIVERSLLDVGAWEGANAGITTMLDAAQRRLTTPRRVRARAEVRSPIARRGAMLEAAKLVEDGIQSAFEYLIPPLCRKHGITMPTAQPEVAWNGRVVHPDFGYPKWKIAMECVGLRPHNDRLALQRDLRRLNTLRGCPWRIIWIEWTQLLLEPEAIVAEIATEIAEAQAALRAQS